MLCKLNKLLILKAIDNGKVPSKRLAAHMARCDSCAAYYQLSRSIDAKLKRSASAPQASVTDLNNRIIAALPPRQQSHTNNATSFTDLIKKITTVPRLATLAVCIIIIAGVSLQIKQHRKMEQYTQAQAAIQSLSDIFASVSQEQKPVMARLTQEPYTQEINNITADAEKTVIFLASCVGMRLPGSLNPSGL
ncbi:MAG: hypothetical protein KAS23_08970 [Anaerohalosphaera sp.]|nr:hypothetical protein [Anaerohalosphaera sp.]